MSYNLRKSNYMSRTELKSLAKSWLIANYEEDMDSRIPVQDICSELKMYVGPVSDQEIGQMVRTVFPLVERKKSGNIYRYCGIRSKGNVPAPFLQPNYPQEGDDRLSDKTPPVLDRYCGVSLDDIVHAAVEHNFRSPKKTQKPQQHLSISSGNFDENDIIVVPFDDEDDRSQNEDENNDMGEWEEDTYMRDNHLFNPEDGSDGDTNTRMSLKRAARSENWDFSEKLYLLELIRQKLDVIEEKKYDGESSRRKADAWTEIHAEFSDMFGCRRDIQRIREQWRRMKVTAKSEIRRYEEELQRHKESGDPPPKRPSQISELIRELVPQDFRGDGFYDDIGDEMYEGLGDDVIIKQEDEESETTEDNLTKFPPSCELRENDSSQAKPSDPQENSSRDTGSSKTDVIDVTSQPEPPALLPPTPPLLLHHLQLKKVRQFDDHSPSLSEPQQPSKRLCTQSNQPSRSAPVTPVTDSAAQPSQKEDFMRSEYQRRLEMLEEEHKMKMEILAMERDIASMKKEILEQQIAASTGSWDPSNPSHIRLGSRMMQPPKPPFFWF